MSINTHKIAILKATELLPRNIQSRIMNNYMRPSNFMRPRKSRNRIAAGGMHSLGLKSDGSVVGWGNDEDEQSASKKGPFVSIHAGYSHSLGLKANGLVVGWGSDLEEQAGPKRGPFVALAVGAFHSLGLKADGSVVGWGFNEDGRTQKQRGPFVAIAAGDEHSLGLKADGSVVEWGATNKGQTEPQRGPFVAISAGGKHSLGLKADGSVVGWGSRRIGNHRGPFVAIATGDEHSLGLKADGSVVGWGSNKDGQITVPNERGPFVAISAGGKHSLGLKKDGSVVGWGDNEDGQAQNQRGHFVRIQTGQNRSNGGPRNFYTYSGTQNTKPVSAQLNLKNKYLEGNLAKMKGIVTVNRPKGGEVLLASLRAFMRARLLNGVVITKSNIERVLDNRRNVDKAVKKKLDIFMKKQRQKMKKRI
jgi:alpha-tubulin suppressor-like RCC1 family protein